MTPLDPRVVGAGWLAAAGVAAATCRLVWRGGRTLNDHVVAAFVTACIGVYPTLLTLAAMAGVRAAWLPWALLPGPLAMWGMFAALDRRKDPGALLTAVGRVAQPAMAFSLWTGLLLGIRSPIVLAQRLSGRTDVEYWPGTWLVLPLALAAGGTVWTYARQLSVRIHRVGVTPPREAPRSAAGISTPGGPGIADRPRELSEQAPRPLRIVHLSDIHASPLMLRRDVAAIVGRAMALSPDLVVATGDFVMPYSEGEHGYLVEELSRFPVPVYGCLGNHDLPVAARLAEEFAALGMRVLVDESEVLDVRGCRVELAGVGFHWRRARERLDEALAGLPAVEADVRLLLAHDPRLFAWLPAGRFDLVLSGHTHGGQVGTDMIGIPWSFLRLLGVFDQGRFERAGSVLWVHRGNWHTGLPPRMGIASEIVVHEVGPAR